MEFVPTSVELVIVLEVVVVLEVEKCDVCVVADPGIMMRSSRVGSPAGDALPSGHPGCGLEPVDIIGVDKPTSSLGGRWVVRDIEAVF